MSENTKVVDVRENQCYQHPQLEDVWKVERGTRADEPLKTARIILRNPETDEQLSVPYERFVREWLGSGEEPQDLCPRVMTDDEVANVFLDQLWVYVREWERYENYTVRERLEGLCHSILVILDGGSPLPAFLLAPAPHPDDREFHADEGENWFPENDEENLQGQIAGCLHDLFYERGRS